MAALLLLQALLELFHQRVPAELVELGFFFGAEVLVHHRLQPFLGQVDLQPGNLLDALEVLPKGLVEAVEMGFVLDQAGAGEEVEIFHAVLAKARLQAFEQSEEFLRRHRQFAGLEVEEEVDEHGLPTGCAGP